MRRILAVMLATMLVPVAGCGQTEASTACESSAPTASPAPGVGQTPWPANHGELSELQSKMEDLAEVYPDVFAGTAMDTDADKVYVWRKPSREFDRAVQALDGGNKVKLLCAAHSADELDAVVRALMRDNEEWTRSGLPLRHFGARHDGSCVEVGTDDPARAQRELGQKYKDYPLCFVLGQQRVPL